MADNVLDEEMFTIHTQNNKKKETKKQKFGLIIVFSVILVSALIITSCMLFKGDYKLLKNNRSHKPKRKPPIPDYEDLEFTEEEHRKLSREFATEGMVLAQNNGLPILKTDKVVLFGKGTVNTRYGGTGSGEVYEKGTSSSIVAVKVSEGIETKGNEGKLIYKVNDKGLEVNGENVTVGELTEDDIIEFSQKEEGVERTVACLTISRTSGEFADRREGDGETGTQLTLNETETYRLLEQYFDQVVIILNVGSVMEIDTLLHSNKTSILIAFLPGMEAGNAIADILVGDANPSGHLSDTWARTIHDYPTTKTFKEDYRYVKYTEGLFVGYRYFEENDEAQSKIVFPFGFGLSYTTFELTSTAEEKDDTITIKTTVKNTGNKPGKQVAQVYVEKPQNDDFAKVKRELVAFSKTKLINPGEEDILTMTVDIKYLSSYDETGVTGNRACYVLEKGEYKLYVGTSVAEVRGDNGLVYTHVEDQLRVTEKLTNRLVPKDPDVANANKKPDFEQLFDNDESKQIDEEPMKKIEKIQIPPAPKNRGIVTLPTHDYNKINMKSVLEGEYTMEELVDSMDEEALAYLTYGHSGKVRTGAGSIGGAYGAAVTGKYLIPMGDTNDGPAGLRHSEVFMQSTAWPSSTCVASSFNLELIEKIGEETGKEARKLGTTFWLAPGMNIHRNPLCGRNFEYYSEDPYLAGKMAAAVTRGLQSKRVSITLKHFFANNKEDNRGGEMSDEGLASDSRMAERVAREIYLRGFEIAVKESKPWAIMTSYNRVNSAKTMESYDLLTGILRKEWGYDGIVMTDWASNSVISREIHAGSNIKMPFGDGDAVISALHSDVLTKGDLKRVALELCNVFSRTAAIDPIFKTPEPVVIKKDEKKRINLYEHIYNKYTGISYELSGDEDGKYSLTGTSQDAWVTVFIDNKDEGYRNFKIRYSAGGPGFGVILKKEEKTLGAIANLHATDQSILGYDWQDSPEFSVYLPEGQYELEIMFIAYDYAATPYEIDGHINWIEIE